MYVQTLHRRADRSDGEEYLHHREEELSAQSVRQRETASTN